MGFTTNKPTISGNLVIDGTLEAKHIKTNSITANKFTGATEEEYFGFFDNVSVAYNTYVTLHEFEFPETELNLVKGRHVQTEWNAFLSTGTSSEVSGNVYLYLEVEVPNTPTFRTIGTAYHDSFPEQYYQRIYFEGNALNRFGCGQVGGLSSYKSYKNLRYMSDFEGSELVTNGTFTSNVNDYTVVDGNFSSYYGAAGYLSQDSTTGDVPFVYQEITGLTVGQKYRFGCKRTGGNRGVEFIVSTSNTLTEADEIHTSGVLTSNATHSADITATATTLYVIAAMQSGSTSGQNVIIDDMTLKPLSERTYADISTSGGQAVPTGGSATLYHHPFGSASSGTWAVVDTKRLNFRTTAYSHYFTMSMETYLGAHAYNYKCRVRARHLNYGDSISTQDSKIFMHSRMIGEAT